MSHVADLVIGILTAEAKRLELPKMHRNDLFIHDHNEILTLGSEPEFLWCLRECGTFLVRLGGVLTTSGKPDPNCSYGQLFRSMDYKANDRHWYHCVKGRLIPVSADCALKIAEDSVRKKCTTNPASSVTKYLPGY